MIRSAALRLTLSYLAIIMALSIGFSFWLYHISSTELTSDLRRPVIFEEITPGSFPNYDQFRAARLAENRRHLQENLLLLNVATLVLGSLASYALAQRTLQPIESALEAQTRFTADASHELRTPLTAMETEIEVALRDKNLSKNEAKGLLASNLEEVVKLKALSESLLKLAGQADQPLELHAVSLSAIAREVESQLVTLAATQQVKLSNKVKDVQVRGDQTLLIELLVILVDNAIKYSPKKTTVTLKSGQHGNSGQLIVRDEGPGIKASELPHIFERFYRIDSSRSKGTTGYGLGLAIAQQIVELHKGSIAVRSTWRSGTTFTVNLPLHKSD